MSLLDSLKTGTARTTNGAVTNPTSLNDCLDFFFIAWAARNMTDQEITSMYSKAYIEDKNKALKLLFWARDVRGWAWERRLFRVLSMYLIVNDPETYSLIIASIPEYWRWDDLWFNDVVIQYTMNYVKSYLNSLEPDNMNNLIFKWLPREKSAKKDIARYIRKSLWLQPKEYRMLLANYSSTVEDKMCAKEWSDIKYKTVPSKAFSIYSKAFMRHDDNRFNMFLWAVEEWTESINAWAIFPTDLYDKYNVSQYWLSAQNAATEIRAINAQWAALPDYLDWQNILPICDVSGSMSWQPMSVSVSLWVYLSERTNGIFKDHFLTFSDKPKLQKLIGKATDRFDQLKKAEWGMSTNLQASFKLILDVAVRDKLAQWHLPSIVLVISDMEFNSATRTGYWGNTTEDTSNLDAIKEQFNNAGYKIPKLVFWNVNGREWNVPAQENETNVWLVSGFSPAIMKSVLSGKDFTPVGIMNTTLEKYDFIDNLIK